MRTLLGILIMALLATGLTLFVLKQEGIAGAGAPKSAYERVMSTGVLRCGYFEEAPFTIVDPNTGRKSGIAVELTEQIAKNNNWKVEWTAPITFATFVTDVYDGKYDAVCGSVFILPRGPQIAFTDPYAQLDIVGYMKAGDVVTAGKVKTGDWHHIRISTMDGEGSAKLSRIKYKEAQFESLPQGVSIANMLTAVEAGKADVVFVLPTEFAKFNAANPGKLVKVPDIEPLGSIRIGLGVSAHAPELKNVFDVTIADMKSTGVLQSLTAKYDPAGLIGTP